MSWDKPVNIGRDIQAQIHVYVYIDTYVRAHMLHGAHTHAHIPSAVYLLLSLVHYLLSSFPITDQNASLVRAEIYCGS